MALPVTADGTPAGPGAPEVAGDRPRLPVGGLIGLATALGAALLLLLVPPSVAPQPPTGEPEMLSLATAWPSARRGNVPGSLPDGAAFSPLYFLDTDVALGTAPTPDASHLRLLLRSADGGTRELRRLPMNGIPQFGGGTVAGDRLVWAETVADDAGLGRTELWTAQIAGPVPATRLTTDTGNVVFFNSQYDLVVDAGVVHWMAVAPGAEPATELRSVPLAGGPVDVRTEPGAWAQSAWPWLVSAGSGQSNLVRLHDLAGQRTLDVDATGDELVTCSPAWCRVLVLPGTGPARVDLMRPDGTDRHRVAGAMTAAAVIDVALLDRFEVLSLAGAPDVSTTRQRLMLYDERDRRTLVVAEGVGMVQGRGGMLWWSTGDHEATVWHALDLRTLA